MGDDLKIVLTSELEADEQASANRISAQLPSIAKLINSRSSIKVGITLDSSNIQSQTQRLAQQITRTVRTHGAGVSLSLDQSSVDKLKAELQNLKVNPDISRAMTEQLDQMGIQIDRITGRWEAANGQQERMLSLAIQGRDQMGRNVSYLQTYDAETGKLSTHLTNVTANLEKQRQAEANLSNQTAVYLGRLSEYEEKLRSSGMLTESLQERIAGLREQFSQSFDKNSLDLCVSQFNQLKSDAGSFGNQLDAVNSRFREMAAAEEKIAAIRKRMLSAGADSNEYAGLRNELAEQLRYQKEISGELGRQIAKNPELIKYASQYNQYLRARSEAVSRLSTEESRAIDTAAEKARKDNESRLSYLNQQQILLDKLNAKYTDPNAAKPIVYDRDLERVQAKYSEVRAAIEALGRTEGAISAEAKDHIASQIAGFEQLAKQIQNAEYVATSLRTKTGAEVNAGEVEKLKAYEEKLRNAGILTEGFQTRIGELRTQLSAAFDSSSLTAYLNSFDRLSGEVDSFKAKIQSVNTLYKDLTAVSGKVAAVQRQMASMDTSSASYAAKARELELLQRQELELGRQAASYREILQYSNQAAQYEQSRLYLQAQAASSEAAVADAAKRISAAMSTVGTSVDLVEAKFRALSNPTDELRAKVENLRILMDAVNHAGSDAEKVEAFKKLNQEIAQCNKQIVNLNGQARIDILDPLLDSKLKKASADLATIARQWSALKSDPGLNKQFQQLQINLKKVRTEEELRKWRAQFSAFNSEVKAAGRNMLSLGDILKNNVKKVAQWISATTLLFRAFRLLKSAVSTIVSLDTAMIDLQKVTTATRSEYERFYRSANDTAKLLGVTTEEVISQTAEWARLGYAMQDAAKLANNSAIFKAISPGMDIGMATDGLVSILKAFDEIDIDDSLDGVISKINDIGNKFAVSNKDIVEVMTRSSSAMKAANNTFEETVALATAAVEITRDSASVGNALKTVSMRIRGYDEELEEYSSDVAELTGEIADLTKTARNNNRGVSLFEAGDPDTYRSTYDILADIAEIWDELTDKNRAQLLEVLFGKRQGQIGSAILSNFEQARSAIETMETSAGSANREMEKIMDSLEYRLNQLRETWVGVAQNLFQTDDLKIIVSGLTAVSNVADRLTNSLGLLGTVGVAAGITGLIRLRSVMSTLTGTITPVVQALSGVSFDGSSLSIVRYAAALESVDATQRRAAMSALGLSQEQQKLVLSTMQSAAASRTFTVAEMEAYLGMTKGRLAAKLNKQATDQLTVSIINEAAAKKMLTEKDARLLLAAFKQSAANELLSASYDKLTMKQKIAAAAASITPAGWITLALTIIPLAVSGFTKLHDVLTVTAEEARTAAGELHTSFEETAGALESLNTELETSRVRLKELQDLSGAGTITLTEKEELDRLEREVELLERRKAILEEQKTNEGKAADAALAKAFDKQRFDSVSDGYFAAEMALLLDERKKLLEDAEKGWSEGTQRRFDEIEKRIRELNSLVYGENFSPDIKVDFKTYAKGLIDTYQMLSKISPDAMTDSSLALFEETRKKLVEAASELQTEWIDNLEVDEETRASWQSLFDAIDRCINPAERFSAALDALPKSVIDTLSQLGASGELTAEKVDQLAEKFPVLASVLEDCNVTSSDAAAHFNALASAGENVSGVLENVNSKAGDLLEPLNELSEKYDLLSAAQKELKEDGGISGGTLDKLHEQYEAMSDIIALYRLGLATAEDVYAEYQRLYSADEKAFLDANAWKIVNTEEYFNQNIKGHKEWIEAIGEYYTADFQNFSQLAQKKLEIETRLIEKLGENWSKYYATYASAVRNSYAYLDSPGDFARSKNSGGMARYESYDDYVEAETRRQYASWTAEQKSAYDSAMALAKTLDSLSTVMSGLGFDLDLGSKASSKKKSSKKEVEEYTASVDQFRDALERLRRAEEETAEVQRRIDQVPNMKIVPQEDIDALEAEHVQLQERNRLLEEALGAIEYYRDVQKEAAGLHLDPEKSVFGNIDLNKRQVLEWTEAMTDQYRDAIASWGESAEELLGSVSTVFGTWDEFDGVPIAFSPMLQTDQGAVYLDADTVYTYISGLIERAGGKGWGAEELLRLDAAGLEVDGRVIKNLLADIGDTAEHTAETMHYLGADGAIKGSYNEIASAADRMGVSVEELVSQYDALNAEYERNEALISSNQSVLERYADAATSQADLIRKQIALRKELIGTYERQQGALQNLNKQRSSAIEDGVEALRKLKFEVQYDAGTNDLWISNMERLNSLTAPNKGKYDTLQEATNALRKDTEDLIETLTDLNDKNRDGANTWSDLGDSIREAKVDIIDDLKDITVQASEAVDEIQNVYNALHNAADEFAENDGFITVDTYQALLELGPQYMQMLKDENGLWQINEERINAVIAARTQQLAVENAMAYVERIKLAAQEGAIEDLNSLIFVTTGAASSTWGLVYAELELMHVMGDLNDSQYQAALHNIKAMQDLAENAVQNIGKATGAAAANLEETRSQLEKTKKGLQDTLDELEDMQDGAGDLIDYVMDMLKHRVQQQIDLLEEMKDKYSDLIALKKESLDASRDEEDYQKSISKKIKEMAKLQERINALSLDDSRSAKAERAKLLEELNELQEDLAGTQADRSVETQKEALDKMEEDYHAEKDEEIKILEKSISSTQKLYDMAIEYIRNNWDTLYAELIEWNTEYGSDLNSEITSAWEAAQAAAQRYGDFVTAIMGGISSEIDGITRQIEELDQQISNLNTSAGSAGSGGWSSGGGTNQTVGSNGTNTAPSSQDRVHSIIKEMYSNMKEHGGSGSSTSESRKKELSARNLQLGAQLRQYGVNAYRSTDKADLGTWYTDPSKKELLFEKYKKYTYHTGGLVGGRPLRPNERYVKAEDGELIMTSEQQNSLADQIDRIGAMAEAFTGAAVPASSPAFRAGLSGAERSTVNHITNNSRPIEISVGDTIIQGSASQETVEAHRRVTERMVNEFARLTGAKW